MQTAELSSCQRSGGVVELELVVGLIMKVVDEITRGPSSGPRPASSIPA